CFSSDDWERLEARCVLRCRQQEEWDLDEITKVMRDADVLLSGWGTQQLTEEVLSPAPNLRLWAHAAGSMASMATDAVWKRELVLTTANDVLAQGVAEFALAITIVALKQVPPMGRALHDGRSWEETRDSYQSRELSSMRVGIAGFGRVGRHLARLLRVFRDLDIVVSDPFAPAALFDEYGVRRMDLAELCATSQVIHNCVPATAKTKGLFSGELLRSMPDHALFINTGRGATVDEEALIEELTTGRIDACLDVTDPEPPEPGSPFYTLPNCLLTPHIAGAVGNGRLLLGRFATDEILRYVDGKPLEGQVSRREVEGMTGGTGG
ncbi:MAG: hydroxyacid dehydrogenase, partial [Candidatus Latescibacterota bacterium]